IDGASEGVGLGHDFLRHVERTKVIVHIVDASGIEGRDPVEDYYRINKELKLYSEKIARRTQILAANKMDLPGAQENLPRLQELADKEGIKLFPISAATRQGLKELIACVSQAIDDYVEEPEDESGEVVYDVQEEDPDKVTITKDYTGVYVVSGKSLNKLVAMTNFGNDEAVRRFQYIWRIKGIDGKLRQRGIKEGDTVRIGEMEFEYRD
ncbi:MAG: Obg family GTPase CgtA, partial [Selenomonadaceae bacterium]|nr:Obg family GTPase CgtA [Selenomonadaceae bacterium]